jgi:hypothetical protein
MDNPRMPAHNPTHTQNATKTYDYMKSIYYLITFVLH